MKRPVAQGGRPGRPLPIPRSVPRSVPRWLHFGVARRRLPRLAVGACAVLLAAPLTYAAALTVTSPQARLSSASATAASADFGNPGAAPTVNWALSGTATATDAA